MNIDDIKIGTEIANGECVFIMRFKDRNGMPVAYFISHKKNLFHLYESSTRGVLSLIPAQSDRMQSIIELIFDRMKPIIKLKHGSN